MTTFEALILGIIQGIAEFLPISSSGHLLIAKELFGLESLESYIFFDLVLHLGTLTAVFKVFFQEIKKLEKRDYLLLFLGSLPLAPLAFFMKPIKATYGDTSLLGYFFLITAFFLYLGVKFGHEKKEKPGPVDAFIIGIFQAIAILPANSRSGSTISAARILGIAPLGAVTFSFLLGIPAILGGTAYEILKSESLFHADVSVSSYFIGFFAAAIFGFLSLRLLILLAIKNNFLYFAYYCIALGIISLLLF